MLCSDIEPYMEVRDMSKLGGFMLANGLKAKVLGDRAEEFHVCAFTDARDSWWHVHGDEEVPDQWFLVPFPDGSKLNKEPE